MYNKVSTFIVNNNILYHQQFGFRQHHSTTQQLLLFLGNVHRALNNCPQCDVIYLDLKKAFDSVPHQELLLKLWKAGVTGSLWNRLEHIMLFFLPNILFRNSLYFYLLCSYDSRLFSYYCPIILINLLKKNQ